MEINQLQNLLIELKTKKTYLIDAIEKEIKFLEENNVQLDINLNELRYNDINGNITNYIELRDRLADFDFIDKIRLLLKQIPISNGSSYFDKFDVNIGIIADEFLYNSFKDVANFYYVERENYKQLKGKIEVLLIASTWKGINGDWKGMGNPNIGKIRKTIFEMIDYFKKDGVKVVFYSKEDPTNYDYFIDIAQKCDYIFTTAVEKVDDYKKDCNNEKVYVLEFGVNPIYNNPIGMKADTHFKGALFAGSWYRKYPHRQKDTKILFDGVLEADKQLKIIDRNFYLNFERHFYPPEYLPNISPSIDHETLQALLKLYKWVLNLNSVKDSRTMFANRVYELQAMGNLILSNYSIGINNLFPNIFLVFEIDEVKNILQNYNDLELYRHRLFGIRQVLKKHTTYHRIGYMLNKIGISVNNMIEKSVAVIVDEKTEKVYEMFKQQSYNQKQLLTVEEALATNKNFDFMTFFNKTSFYGDYYLEDMINAFKYTDVDFVTKDSYFNNNKKIDGTENNYINKMKCKFRTIFSLKNYSMSDIITNIDKMSFENGYSCDSLEYNVNSEQVFVTNPDKKFTVIIPTYNNGQHLYGKCFMSLRRSSMFEQMEIIIVDDGSTDEETEIIIDRLNRHYDNVKIYKFNDGGSGSASRPRNKGIELSTTNYITFLDPDNEAVNDGYTKLYQELIDSNYDMVIGNMKKVDIVEHDFNYFRDVIYYQAKNEFNHVDSREFLESTHFKAQSIQGLMIKKEVILNNNIEMVLGAVGQDTLFFHELIINSKSFKVIDEIIHIYYSGVEGSTVNNITIKTFEKYYVLEKARVEFLKRENLLKPYINKRFNYYFKNWYLKKLEMVKEEHYDEATKYLYDIYNLYESNASLKKIDSDIKLFIKKLKRKHGKFMF